MKGQVFIEKQAKQAVPESVLATLVTRYSIWSGGCGVGWHQIKMDHHCSFLSTWILTKEPVKMGILSIIKHGFLCSAECQRMIFSKDITMLK